MKKSSTKRFTLSRETIRNLKDQQVQEVNGGVGTQWCTRANSCDPESVFGCTSTHPTFNCSDGC